MSARQQAEWDERLAGLLRADTLPPLPRDLESRVRRRVRSHRTTRRALTAAAASLTAAAALVVWQMRPKPTNDGGGTPVATTRHRDSPAASGHGLAELALLSSSPPVESLSMIERQQAAYVAALAEIAEGR